MKCCAVKRQTKKLLIHKLSRLKWSKGRIKRMVMVNFQTKVSMIPVEISILSIGVFIRVKKKKNLW